MQTNNSEPNKKIIDFEKLRYMKENRRKTRRRTVVIVVAAVSAVVIALLVFLGVMAGRMFGGSGDFWNNFASGVSAVMLSPAVPTEGMSLFR